MEEILELLKDPEAIGALHDIIEVYKEPIYSVLGEFVSIWKDFINSDYYDLTAASQSKMFEAYRDAGFSEDQAMMLLLNNHLEVAQLSKSINVNKRK